MLSVKFVDVFSSVKLEIFVVNVVSSVNRNISIAREPTLTVPTVKV